MFDTPPEVSIPLPSEDVEGLPAPPAAARREEGKRSREKTPPANLAPYPFTGYPAQASSEDTRTRIPFPPSPTKHEHEVGIEVEGEEDDEEGEEGVEASVKRRRNVVVKVRKTEWGIERQKVVREVEEWRWVEGASADLNKEVISLGGVDEGDTKMGDPAEVQESAGS